MDDAGGAVLVPDAVGIVVVGDGDVDPRRAAGLEGNHDEAAGLVVIEALGVEDEVRVGAGRLEEAGGPGGAQVGREDLVARVLVIEGDRGVDRDDNMVGADGEGRVRRRPFGLGDGLKARPAELVDAIDFDGLPYGERACVVGDILERLVP